MHLTDVLRSALKILSRQRGRIAVQNGMTHPQHVWPASAGALREPMLLLSTSGYSHCKVCVRGTLGTERLRKNRVGAPISHKFNYTVFSRSSHVASIFVAPLSLIALLLDLRYKTTTATRSPPFSPTSFPPFDLWTTTISAGRNCTASVCPHIQSLAPFRSY